MRRRHQRLGHHQHPITSSQEVNLDGVNPREFQIVPLLEVQALTLCRPLVGGAQNLDGGHDAVSRLDVDDFDVAFGDRLDVEMDQDRLGRSAVVVDVCCACGLDDCSRRSGCGRAPGRWITRTSG